MTTEVCDICRSPEVGWAYPAYSFVMMPKFRERPYVSVGGWAVCIICKDLIEADQWGELARWGAQELVRRDGLDETAIPSVVQWITDLHMKFRENRNGPAVPNDEYRPEWDDPEGGMNGMCRTLAVADLHWQMQEK